MTTADPGNSLSADAWARIRPHWKLKFFGISAFITVFFFAYFLLQSHPMFPVHVIPLTALDRLIPFQPGMLGLYLSLWFYVSLPPTLMPRKPELYAYGWIAGAVAVTGLAFFFFWPTSIPVTTGIEWQDYPGFGWLKSIDAAQNACPSLHVAFAVFTGVWLDRVLRRMPKSALTRPLNAVWAFGIVYSTLATRQHVALDAYAGTALGLFAAWYRPAVLK
ncbi:MAG: hypothetical protein JWM35_1300 [Verrucomicrobia bacterium]|nr:hypothetical protein [Verrucomicrobiota bacterium]